MSEAIVIEQMKKFGEKSIEKTVELYTTYFVSSVGKSFTQIVLESPLSITAALTQIADIALRQTYVDIRNEASKQASLDPDPS